MSEIKRYDATNGAGFCADIYPEEQPDGEFVFYDDHTAKVAELEAEVERLKYIKTTAQIYVTDSHRPSPKYDAERFDRLVKALNEYHQLKESDNANQQPNEN